MVEGGGIGDSGRRLGEAPGRHCRAQAAQGSALEPRAPPCASARAPRAIGGSLCRCQDSMACLTVRPCRRGRLPPRRWWGGPRACSRRPGGWRPGWGRG
eukprot:scaffold50935_cov44-Phaeocystis_antarctica.AAC.1